MSGRLVVLGIFLAAAVAVVADDAAARRRSGENVAPRTGDGESFGAQASDGTAAVPTVDKVCGFSPCGLPLPCD